MKYFLSFLYTCLFCIQIYGQTTQSKPELGRHILGVSPAQVLIFDQRNNQQYAEVAVNINYENISANKHFGLRIPVSVALKNQMIALMPQLKIYPTGQGPVRLAFGPQFYFSFDEVTHTLHTNYEPNKEYLYTTVDENRFQVGFLVSSSLNIILFEYLYVGIDGGLGLNYYNSESKYIEKTIDGKKYIFQDYRGQQLNPVLQLSFVMGYRF